MKNCCENSTSHGISRRKSLGIMMGSIFYLCEKVGPQKEVLKNVAEQINEHHLTIRRLLAGEVAGKLLFEKRLSIGSYIVSLEEKDGSVYLVIEEKKTGTPRRFQPRKWLQRLAFNKMDDLNWSIGAEKNAVGRINLVLRVEWNNTIYTNRITEHDLIHYLADKKTIRLNPKFFDIHRPPPQQNPDGSVTFSGLRWVKRVQEMDVPLREKK